MAHLILQGTNTDYPGFSLLGESSLAITMDGNRCTDGDDDTGRFACGAADQIPASYQSQDRFALLGESSLAITMDETGNWMFDFNTLELSRYVTAQLTKAAQGADTAEVAVPLKIALALEGVKCEAK